MGLSDVEVWGDGGRVSCSGWVEEVDESANLHRKARYGRAKLQIPALALIGY